MAKLFYQGHASFRLTTSEGKVIFIDPFAGEGYKTPADLVLITHEHYDHNDINLITFNPGGYAIRSKDALADGVYRTFETKGLKIKAVPAYNSHHDKNACVGYLIEVEGIKLYHPGDTDFIPEMLELKNENIDYALLPIDGTYTMTPEDATKAAIAINPKHMIPMHMRPGVLIDIKQAMRVTAPMAMLMRPNEEIELEK
ncbi:MAG: MBL fold metallo-hydrolase [Bacilli bacterium]|nr:MBL fold metallo-hydrolase [Bacilli bacterium]